MQPGFKKSGKQSIGRSKGGTATMTTIKGFEIWDNEFDKKHFTPEEIAESDMRAI